MGKPVTPDQLASEIEKILKSYEGDLDRKVGEAMGKVARKGVQMLKATSPKAENSEYSGEYANSWTMSVENHRDLTHEAVIYNKHAGMPHLLENGHLMRNGKRTKKQEHIKPVADVLASDFRVEDLLP